MTGRRPRDGSQYCVLVIDDGFWGPEKIGPDLRDLLVSYECVSHMKAESLRSWAKYDLVLLDAYDDIGLRHDALRTRLGALPILRRAVAQSNLPRVAVYSTEIGSPFIRVPLREVGVISQFLSAAEVADAAMLTSLLSSQHVDRSSLELSEADWSYIGLPQGALLGEAHERVRLDRPSVWQLILHNPPLALSSDADRKWIKRTINPLLGIDARWSRVRQIIRSVAR